ncbi:MAG: hypothetical protein PHF17_11005 [Arcobacteraceae bacterium]|jgi:hypothetical protein|nr:hypothetical protein [Arcobacteraceae bacterium]
MIQTIFLQNNTTFKPLHKKEKVNLILSPSFYWVKLFTIPVESENKALFLLPNLFEDYFDIAGYSFYTIKVGENQYLSFAYDEDKIIQKLKSLNIPQNKILHIYFAQNEFKNILLEDEKIALSYEDEVFMYKQNLLVKIPNNLAQQVEKKPINLTNLTLSENFIELFSYKKLTSNKSAQLASSILLGFAILLFVQTFLFKQLANSYPSKIETIKQQYNLPPTAIQANAIVETYGKSERQYKRYRDAIGYALGANTIDGVTILEIHLEKNILNLTYKVKEGEMLENYLKKEFRKTTLRVENDKAKVRIEL